jgi:serine/threonine protein kinase
MKCQDKKKIIEEDLVKDTILEKNILEKIKHPFLMDMSYVFQTKSKILFVMRFVRGGELYG